MRTHLSSLRLCSMMHVQKLLCMGRGRDEKPLKLLDDVRGVLRPVGTSRDSRTLQCRLHSKCILYLGFDLPSSILYPSTTWPVFISIFVGLPFLPGPTDPAAGPPHQRQEHAAQGAGGKAARGRQHRGERLLPRANACLPRSRHSRAAPHAACHAMPCPRMRKSVALLTPCCCFLVFLHRWRVGCGSMGCRPHSSTTRAHRRLWASWTTTRATSQCRRPWTLPITARCGCVG